MASAVSPSSIRLAEYGCLTALGDTTASYKALCAGKRALSLQPVRGRDGGDRVPMALASGHSLDESAPPSWLPHIRQLVARISSQARWGTPRRPVFVTSSNFGVGSLYAFRRSGDTAHLRFGTPSFCVDWLQAELDWGNNLTIFSHACVSAHLGLLAATRTLQAGLADEALIFSFDFLSPFVAGGFHALKILNSEFPAPYEDRANGSIGLGDGAGYAVLSPERGDLSISGQSVYNEMHHFTANQPEGTGFDACLAPLRVASAGRRLWLKGHGTGTIEAGRLEAQSLLRVFGESPLVSWKGSLGHTLGSCGLVELAIAAEALRHGTVPGTIGSHAPGFTSNVAFGAFSTQAFDGVICTSNAFGGAHAGLLLTTF